MLNMLARMSGTGRPQTKGILSTKEKLSYVGLKLERLSHKLASQNLITAP
jgi:hypothetical protein